MLNPFSAKQRARVRAFFGKPANIILVTFCALLSVLTLYPLILLFLETITVHAGKEVRATKLAVDAFSKYSFEQIFATAKYNYSKLTFYEPLLNTLAVSLTASFIAIFFGGAVAWLITRTNLKYKKFISGMNTPNTDAMMPLEVPAPTLTFLKKVCQKVASVQAGMM